MFRSSDRHGSPNTLFIPDWQLCSSGDRISVVVDRLIWGAHTGLSRLTPSGRVVRINGLIPPEAPGFAKITVMDAQFLTLTSILDLSLDERSTVLCHQPASADSLLNLVELCAGAGLSALGFKRAGFVHRAAVELRPSLASLHGSLHEGVPVICSDITQDSTACKIFAVCPEPCTLMAGVSCQPFSRGGLTKGDHDERSNTFPAAFRMQYLLQAPVLVVECVVPAQHNGSVKEILQVVQDQLGLHITQCSMKLEHVWSACRYRWWLIATIEGLGRVKIPAFPVSSPLVVRDLMPVVRQWTDQDESQLRLTELELERFQLGGVPLKHHEVKPDMKLPTALHSWGSQTQGCSCGCREFGFSDALLATKGVYAQLVKAKSDEPGLTIWRHLHVLEVSLLSGVPLDLNWGSDARLNVCAIGQMAAPMQSLWVAVALVRHVQILLTSQDLIDPMRVLNALKQDILTQSKEVFPVLIPVPRELLNPPVIEVCVSLDGCPPWSVRAPACATVRNLVHAECRLQGLSGIGLQVLDATGLPVLPDQTLDKTTTLQIQSGSDAPIDAFQLPPVGNPADQPIHALPLAAPTQEDAVSEVLSDADMPTAPVPGPLGAVSTSIATVVSLEHLSPEPSETLPGPLRVESTLDPLVGSVEHLSSVPTSSVPGSLRAVSTSDPSVESLLHLTSEQLLAMLPPLVVDSVLCTTMRRNTLSHDTRFNLLQKQGKIWSDDEIWWHLKNVTPRDASHPVVFLDPLLATSWCAAGTAEHAQTWLLRQPPFMRLASVVLLAGHWIPCIWYVRETSLEVHVWDHTESDINGLNPLHGLLCGALGKGNFQVSCTRRNFGLEHCGAAAISFLHARLGIGFLPETDEQLAYAATCLRTDFQLEHAEATLLPRPWCWGGAVTDLDGLVSSLLQQHGVPSSSASGRAKLIIQA